MYFILGGMENATIKNIIYEVRGMKVMLDFDLAKMYEVETFNLNKAVKRNIERFPEDFMFQLTKREWEFLRSQIGMSSLPDNQTNTNLKFQNGMSSWGGIRRPPYVFTEQGVAMLSSVLRSERAIAVNIAIMRAFVAVRRALPLVASQKDLEDLKGRVRLLEVAVTEETAAIGDMRDELRNIYAALDQMQQQPQKSIEPVGYEATLERERNGK